MAQSNSLCLASNVQLRYMYCVYSFPEEERK